MTTKVVIDGIKYPLRFGMGFVRALAGKAGQEMTNEHFMAFVIHAAHQCFCDSRQIVPSMEYFQALDFVEISTATGKMDQVTSIMTAYNQSIVVKETLKAADEDKEPKKDVKKKKSTSRPGSALHTDI